MQICTLASEQPRYAEKFYAAKFYSFKVDRKKII